jgi:hypothetical protein
MLWYSSYWDTPDSAKSINVTVPLILATLLTVSTVD